MGPEARGRGACGVVTRGPGFLCHSPFTCDYGLYCFVYTLLSGGRGDEGAATEPALQGGTADSSLVWLNASMMKQKKKRTWTCRKEESGHDNYRVGPGPEVDEFFLVTSFIACDLYDHFIYLFIY